MGRPIIATYEDAEGNQGSERKDKEEDKKKNSASGTVNCGGWNRGPPEYWRGSWGFPDCFQLYLLFGGHRGVQSGHHSPPRLSKTSGS
jgi:hypothetical protein